MTVEIAHEAKWLASILYGLEPVVSRWGSSIGGTALRDSILLLEGEPPEAGWDAELERVRGLLEGSTEATFDDSDRPGYYSMCCLATVDAALAHVEGKLAGKSTRSLSPHSDEVVGIAEVIEALVTEAVGAEGLEGPIVGRVRTEIQAAMQALTDLEKKIDREALAESIRALIPLVEERRGWVLAKGL